MPGRVGAVPLVAARWGDGVRVASAGGDSAGAGQSRGAVAGYPWVRGR
jgi:hypothetical protein